MRASLIKVLLLLFVYLAFTASFYTRGGMRLRYGRISAQAVTTTSTSSTTTTLASTTSSSTSTIATTTSTSSTTSTSLEPLGLNMIWGPIESDSQSLDTDGGFPAANNDLLCTEWTPSIGISGGNKLAIIGGGGSGTYALAIYSHDGSSEIVEGIMANSFSAPVTDLSTSPASFDINPGTQYRVCICVTDSANFSYASMQGETFHPWDNTARWGNLFGTRYGVAANPCVAGDPPSTTGALTPPSLACTSGTCDGSFPVTTFDQVTSCTTANPSSFCDGTFPLFAVGGSNP